MSDPFQSQQHHDDLQDDPIPNEFFDAPATNMMHHHQQQQQQQQYVMPFPLNNVQQLYTSHHQNTPFVLMPHAQQQQQYAPANNVQLYNLLMHQQARPTTPHQQAAAVLSSTSLPSQHQAYYSYAPTPVPQTQVMYSLTPEQLHLAQMQYHHPQQQIIAASPIPQKMEQQQQQPLSQSPLPQQQQAAPNKASKKRPHASMSQPTTDADVQTVTHSDKPFVLKQKCFKTMYGIIVEPKSSIQILVKPEIVITQVMCKTIVREGPKEGKKKKSKVPTPKDYYLSMVFEYEDESMEPKLKKPKKSSQDADKTLIFRFKPREKAIIEEKVAKNTDNAIVLKQSSSIEMIEVPHMLTSCLPASIELSIKYRTSDTDEEHTFVFSDIERETFIFLSRVPDIVQVQKYFSSLLKSYNSISLEFVQQWLLDIVRNTYNPYLTDKEGSYLTKDLTLNEREHMIQFASNMYQFHQCVQYNSKFGVSALKYMWENRLIAFISFEEVKQRLEKHKKGVVLRWVGGASEKQLKRENNLYGCIYVHFLKDDKFDTITFHPNRSKAVEEQIQEYFEKYKALVADEYCFLSETGLSKRLSEVFPAPIVPSSTTTTTVPTDNTPTEAVKEAIQHLQRVNK